MAKRNTKAPVVKVRQGDDISMVIVPIALSLGRYASSSTTNYALRLLVSKLQGVMQHHLKAQSQSGCMDDGQIVLAFEEQGFEVAQRTTQFVNKGEFLYTVSLKDLGVDRQHYAEFFDAIVRAGEYRIEYEGDDPELGHGLTWYNLYRPILWNYREEEYTDKKGNVSTRYVSTQGPKITIAIEPRAAQTIYNPARHGKSIDTTGVKLHAYTERILYLFAPYWQQYTHIEIDWIALRLKMQLDEDITPRSQRKIEVERWVREDEPGGRKRGVYISTAPGTVIRQTEKYTDGPHRGKPRPGGYRRTYESWSEFQREVLAPTIADFNGMAAVGRVPFTFTAEVVKQSIPGKSNRPTPVRVIFDLTLTDAGRQSMQKSAETLERIELKKHIMQRLGIRENYAARLVNAERVGPATYADLRAKVDELRARVDARDFAKCDTLQQLIAAEKAVRHTIPKSEEHAATIAALAKARKRYEREMPKYLFACLQDYIKNDLGFTAAEDVTATTPVPASPSAAVCQPVSPADPAGPVSSAAISSQATPDPLTPAQARQLAQAALGGAGEQPRAQYDFTGARLTITADEQQQLHAFRTDLHCTYATTAPAFVTEVVEKLLILRVNDARRVITFHLADGTHLTTDRLNYYAPGLAAQFVALFHVHFPDGYKFCFD